MNKRFKFTVYNIYPLPDEIIDYIATFIELNDLLNLMLTNKKMFNLLSNSNNNIIGSLYLMKKKYGNYVKEMHNIKRCVCFTSKNTSSFLINVSRDAPLLLCTNCFRTICDDNKMNECDICEKLSCNECNYKYNNTIICKSCIPKMNCIDCGQPIKIEKLTNMLNSKCASIVKGSLHLCCPNCANKAFEFINENKNNLLCKEHLNAFLSCIKFFSEKVDKRYNIKQICGHCLAFLIHKKCCVYCLEKI